MKKYKIYGLLGRRLGHSLSPQIHELIFNYTELEGDYKLYPMEPECIKEFVLKLYENNISGLNVTIPYKNDVILFLNSISDEAKKIGAANTILPTSSGLSGHNTDYFGVKQMLKAADITAKGKRALVLGSGGSARTVTALLKDENCSEITLVSRSKIDAMSKFTDINVIEYNELKQDHGYELLINTTPVGMYPDNDSCPLGQDIIKGFLEVVDLIYNPGETRLLKYAKQNGLKHVNGLYMLVAQAVKAQEIWNDIVISDDVIGRIYSDLEEV